MPRIPWFKPPVLMGMALALIVAGLIGYGFGYTFSRYVLGVVSTPTAVASERDYLEESRANYAAVYAEYSAVRLYQEAIDKGIETQRNALSGTAAHDLITRTISNLVGSVGSHTARFSNAIEAYNNAALHVDTMTLLTNRLPLKLYIQDRRLVEDTGEKK